MVVAAKVTLKVLFDQQQSNSNFLKINNKYLLQKNYSIIFYDVCSKSTCY